VSASSEHLAARLRDHLLAHTPCTEDAALRRDVLDYAASVLGSERPATEGNYIDRLAAVRPGDVAQATLLGLTQAYWLRCSEQPEEAKASAESSVVEASTDHDDLASPLPQADYDGAMRWWDAATGAPIGDTMMHGRRVSGATYLADATGGARVLSWSEDRTVRWWDAATGAPVGDTMRHKDRVAGASYVADGSGGARVLSWSDDHTVRWWDACRCRSKSVAICRCGA
jgi:WD40 repeat protein